MGGHRHSDTQRRRHQSRHGAEAHGAADATQSALGATAAGGTTKHTCPAVVAIAVTHAAAEPTTATATTNAAAAAHAALATAHAALVAANARSACKPARATHPVLQPRVRLSQRPQPHWPRMVLPAEPEFGRAPSSLQRPFLPG